MTGSGQHIKAGAPCGAADCGVLAVASGSVAQLFAEHFGSDARPFYVQAEAPGRLEVIGNHTDHQGGCVISAALACTVQAFAAPNNTMDVRAWLEGFDPVEIDLTCPDAFAPAPAERGTSTALIRGMLAGYAKSGGSVRGFDMVVCSNLPVGAGVSSSAAFEVLVGAVLRGLDGGVASDAYSEQQPRELLLSDDERIELALQGVNAEQAYFGKSCGAQDQLASALGGLVFMDFSAEKPQIERISANLNDADFCMLLIDSLVDHSRYAADYDSVPADMTAAACQMGFARLGDSAAEEFEANVAQVVLALGQSVADRASHFYAETARVQEQKQALADASWQEFLRLETASGVSSETLLCNIVPSCAAPDDEQARRPQRILDFCAQHLAEGGAWRIHGGGFGGSVLAFVPHEQKERFVAEMNTCLGYDACRSVEVSCLGARVWRCATCEAADNGRIYWQGDSEWGTLEVSINLRKPEKDPRSIAVAANTASTDVGSMCDLCAEAARFDAARELACEPRLVNPVFTLDGETWRIHFSPYGYFPQHCVVQTDVHRPMRVDRACLARLLACVDRFPFFFMGCNADLPLVGGSILAHDHFQGGGYVFPLMRAGIERSIELGNHPLVQAGIVQWPSSVLRLTCNDSDALVAAAMEVADAWERFDCPSCEIVSHTGDTRHNAITTIAYRSSFVNGCAQETGSDPYVLDIVLRNNRTNVERPFGIFHPDESLHYIKKENIGLIEIMGLAILPARLATQMHSVATSVQTQQAVTQAFVRILECTGVFKADDRGRQGWRQFVKSIHGSI